MNQFDKQTKHFTSMVLLLNIDIVQKWIKWSNKQMNEQIIIDSYMKK